MKTYGPWALVVGASDGIGLAFARALAEAGLNLVLVARRAALLDSVAASLDVQVRVLAVDAGTPAGLAAILAAEEDIGLVVCNASYGPIAPFLDLTPEQLDAMLDLNCRLAVQVARGYGARFAARGSGGVVLLSSLASYQGTALVAHYSATKAYLRVLAEGLWDEWRPAGVDVIACCPGLVSTPTFHHGEPQRSRLVPPPVPPDLVARVTLAALGRAPVVTPGWRNRLASVAARLLPRRQAVALASRQTRRMYPMG